MRTNEPLAESSIFVILTTPQEPDIISRPPRLLLLQGRAHGQLLDALVNTLPLIRLGASPTPALLAAPPRGLTLLHTCLSWPLSSSALLIRYIREPAHTSSHIMLWPTTGTLPICEPLRDVSCTVLPLDLLDQLAEVAVLLNGRARAASEKVPPGEILLAPSSLTLPVPLGRINAPHAFLPPLRRALPSLLPGSPSTPPYSPVHCRHLKVPTISWAIHLAGARWASLGASVAVHGRHGSATAIVIDSLVLRSTAVNRELIVLVTQW